MASVSSQIKTLMTHLEATFPSGEFSVKVDDFQDIIHTGGNNRRIISTLVEKGYLKLVTKATKSGKTWVPAKYQVLTANSEPLAINQRTEKGLVLDYFKGREVAILEKDGKKLISIVSISDALQIGKNTIYQLISRHERLFAGQEVFVSASATKNGTSHYLTKNGVIALLMKLSYPRLGKEKRELLIDFQIWAIGTLENVLSGQTVKMGEEETKAITKTMGALSGIDPEELVGILRDSADILGDATVKVNQLKIQAGCLSEQLDTVNQKLAAVTERLNISEAERKYLKEDCTKLRKKISDYQIVMANCKREIA